MMELRLRLHIILRTFVEPTLSPRLFAWVSFDAGGRAALARLPRLISVGRPIYGCLHLAHREGDSICFPFYATTSFAAVGFAQATTSTTVSIEKNRVKSDLTVWHNRRRHGLPESDRFESQQLIK